MKRRVEIAPGQTAFIESSPLAGYSLVKGARIIMLLEGEPDTVVLGMSRNVGVIHPTRQGIFKKYWFATANVPDDLGQTHRVDAQAGPLVGHAIDNTGVQRAVYRSLKHACMAVVNTIEFERTAKTDMFRAPRLD